MVPRTSPLDTTPVPGVAVPLLDFWNSNAGPLALAVCLPIVILPS